MYDPDLIYAPVSKPQESFLMSDAYFTLYGGAAGAGKSAALLGAILPLWDNPETSVLIVRKTTKQLSGAGSLFDAATQLYRKIDKKLRVNSRDLIMTFSSGAKVQFTYLDKDQDKENIQGKEYSLICFDECQQLSESNVLYALSRLRKPKAGYPLRALATANPDYDSFLRRWVEFALDQRGIPVRNEEANYPLRYFVQTPVGMKWFDDRKEAEAIYGTGDDSGIKSFRFIPATALDNPILIKNNPEYISTLKGLPRVEMERLLLGSWYAREQSSGYFKREWVSMVETFNFNADKRVRSWDLAFTKPSEANPDVDATAGVLMSRETATGQITVEDVRLMRDRVHEVERLIFDTAESDGFHVTITLPLDPGATGSAYCRNLAARLADMGYHVKLIRPEKAKQQRFLPFASAAEARKVSVVKADWNDEFFTELETTDFGKKTHDDQADACSDGFYTLARNLTLPTFALPDLSSTPSFSGLNTGASIPLSGLSIPTSAF